MFIKRIEIFGFKSFKNKTVLEFAPQEMAGIVGPNGCGKSNLADALLWVMGENSPKRLRAGELSDVFFSGTAKEPAGNLAEVSLILDPGKTGFPEGYKSFSELMIARRAYRGGKSECFINQQACLLKDIREFFLNTGAGCRGFSIIEQEAIEKLIAAKPSGRRFIIEEVAGISKFKSRKAEAINKLALANQNLQRLNDILKLQESQLNQLAHQAKQAEKYKKIKQDIESGKKQLEKREQEELFRSYQRLREERNSLKAGKQEKKRVLQGLKKQIEEGAHKLQEAKARIEGQISAVEKARQSLLDKKMEEAGWLDKKKAFEMAENIEGRKKDLQKKEQAIRKDLSKIQGFFSQLDIKELRKEAQHAESHLSEIKQNKKEAEIKNESLLQQLGFVEKEIKILVHEKNSAQKSIQKAIHAKNKISADLKKRRQAQSALSQERDGLSEKEKAMESEKLEAESQVQALQQSSAALRYKIEEMKKLLARFSAVNEGANDLIQWSAEDFQPLFQKLEAEDKYATALGAVLGHYDQALIPKNGTEGILKAAQRLKTRKIGKTGFLSPLPSPSAPLSLRREISAYPAFICFLDEPVKWSASLAPLKPLLGQTAVVSDLNSAFELKTQFPAFQFVTPEGDLVTRDSWVYTGSSNKETSLLEIRSQIRERLKELSAEERLLKIAKMDLKARSQKLAPVQERAKILQSQIAQGAELLIVMQKDQDQMEKDLLRLLDSRKKNKQRAQDFEKEKQNMLLLRDGYHQEIQSLEEDVSFKESRLQAAQEAISAYEAQNLKKMKWSAELMENSKDQKNADKEIALLLHLIRPSSAPGEPLDCQTARLNLDKEIHRVREERQQLADRLSQIQQDLERERGEKEQGEKHRKDLEDRLFQAKLDESQLKLEEEKNKMEGEHLENKFLESYQFPIHRFVSSPEEAPLEKLKEEILRHEERLSRIKEINFLALEEYEKLSKENFFLIEQKEDLAHSKKEILKMISHIDKLCDTRFNSMLEEVNKRFSKVFPIVFQGDQAKAQLLLCEPAEGQEPGVDILIQPPGKKPQSVNLLSRGEKALASICLIYSLFLVKPSPFCIIDEADAPLDDANIFRFLSVLKEMSRKSQIIAITHNKYTMQACQKLYGVTMERPGVSQIVSVDMKAPKLSPS